MASPRAPTPTFPSYQGRAAELFDDTIEPSAVGFDLEGREPKAAPQALAELAQSADAIVRVRVVTVTSNSEPFAENWQVGLEPLTNVGGPRPRYGYFTLVVNASDPAARVLRAVETRLVGTTFVAFTREFATASSEPDQPGHALHFHVVRDSRDELEAIDTALVLGGFR